MNRIQSKAFIVVALLAAGAPVRAGAQEARRPEAKQKEAPPAPLPPRPVAFPAFHERTLRNGARVIVVENHEQPVVTLSLRLASGAKHDPAGKSGVASFTASLLDKGTATRSAAQIAESIDFVGGSLGASAGDDWIDVSATVLTEFLDTALVLVSDIVRNPAFPEEELETWRKRALSELQARLGQPSYLAQRRFLRELYGGHPYGADETPESVGAITRGDVAAFHRAHFRPANALFVVAGDVRPDDVVRRLERRFEGWTGAGESKASFPAPPERTAREVVFVHKPGAVQAVIRVGHLLPPATHRDWVALDVANQVLGGGTTGWLFQVLRQQKGYTYGAYASAAKRQGPGYFMAWAEVRNEVADSALAEVFRLLGRLRDEPVPAADLRAARDYITGSFPLDIETPQQVANQVANARLLGLPRDYVAEYRDRVAAVGAGEVRRAARAHVRPDRALVVVVGDATKVLEKVSGFGPVRLVDADGDPLDPAALEARGADITLDGASIPAGTHVYDFIVQGNAVGQIVRTTAREEVDGTPVVRATSTMSAMGMSLTQEVAFEVAGLRPVFSRTVQAMGPDTMASELRAEGGKVLGRATGPDGRPRDISVDLLPGLLLPGMDAYALMVADLGRTKRFHVPSVDERTGGVTTLEFAVAGETKVTVAAGEFEAYEVGVSGGRAPLRLFVRKAAPHILLKQEIAGQPVTIELKELK